MTPNHLSQILNAQRRCTAMNHRVTVRTNRTQICNRINLILCLNLRQRLEVVNVNECAAKLTKHLLEVEVADCATITVVLDAPLACVWATLVDIDGNLSRRTLEETRRCRHLVGQKNRLVPVTREKRCPSYLQLPRGCGWNGEPRLGRVLTPADELAIPPTAAGELEIAWAAFLT